MAVLRLGRLRTGPAGAGKCSQVTPHWPPPVEDAFPGSSKCSWRRLAARGGPVHGAGDSLASVQAALPAPGITQAGAAFSPAKGITTGYAEVVDA